VDLIDVHIFYWTSGIRTFYKSITNQIIDSQDHQVLSNLFIIFLSILVLLFLLVQCFLMWRIRLSFWNFFYILRLIPKDEVDKEFIKRINDYLSLA
jgi:hypothetical protein